ncbi:hypothetical protein Gohar_017318, partial [Gossypium harknessii]|nr:hypothetical protein [Gossypium harknessii]
MPFGLILGPDSPSVDKPCGGTLGFLGHWILTNVCVTQADILAFTLSTPAHADASPYGGMLPYQGIFTSHSFDRSLSPVHLWRKSTRSVSYYTLFQGWLLLGKPPSCLCTLPSLSLSDHLGALAGDPGCFPLDDEAYTLLSHWLTTTPVILRSYLVFRVCLNLEELASFGFKWHFSLNDNSSADSSTLVGSDLQLVSPKLHPVGSLNQATAYESLTPSLTATRSEPRAHPTAWELTISCSISLPDRGSFHPSLTSECKLAMLLATRLSTSRVRHFNASSSSRMLLLISYNPVFTQQFKKLTYSGISGSTLIFNSPKHFVAYYSLPRLWVPRYP